MPIADTEALAESVKTLVQRYQHIMPNNRTAEQPARRSHNARLQLLSYQVEELDKIDLGTDELDELENERRTLANGEAIQRNSQHALALCREGEINVVNILNQALKSLGDLDAKQPALVQAEEHAQQRADSSRRSQPRIAALSSMASSSIRSV